MTSALASRWWENRITDRGDRRVCVRTVDNRHPVGTVAHMGGRGARHLLRGDPAKLFIPLSDARHVVGISSRRRLASSWHNTGLVVHIMQQPSGENLKLFWMLLTAVSRDREL